MHAFVNKKVLIVILKTYNMEEQMILLGNNMVKTLEGTL